MTDDASPETARVDQWLWAVRLYHSRSSAASACRAGRVKVNGRTAKPAASVRQGDQVEARMDRRVRVVEVVKIIDKRVAHPSLRSASSTTARRPTMTTISSSAASREPAGRRSESAVNSTDFAVADLRTPVLPTVR